MRKKILPFIVIVVAGLLLSTMSCKKANLDLSWYSMEGSGDYNSQDDTSSISLSGFVSLSIPQVATDEMWAEIVAWEFLVLEDSDEVLEINSNNYYTILGDLTLNQSSLQTDYVWVVLQTLTRKAGDIYEGANPNSLHMTFWIIDNNGNSYVMDDTVEFQFNRE